MQASKVTADLRGPTRKIFDRLMEIVHPEEILAIRPINDPQDLTLEETKVEGDLVAKVASECQDFCDEKQAYEASFDDELKELDKQRTLLF